MALLLLGGASARADKPRDSDILNFIVEPTGRILQIRAVKGPQVSLGKGFPLWWKNRGFVLEDAATGKALKRFLPAAREVGVLLGAYPLDGERVVCNLQNDAGPRRYHTAIWNRKTEALHLLPGTGSGWTYEVSGVSPAETQVISVSYGSRIALLHDRETERASALFPEFQVACPRYSPDGTSYAFYGAERQFPLSREQELVIQPLDGSPARHILLQNQPHRNEPPRGKTLAWSPSGTYLAGYVLHDLVPRLFLWDAGGKLLQTVDIPFAAASWLAPVWLPDERGVMFLSEGIGHGPPRSITVPVPADGTASESTR